MTTTTVVVKVVDMSTGAKIKGGSEVVEVAIAHMLGLVDTTSHAPSTTTRCLASEYPSDNRLNNTKRFQGSDQSFMQRLITL